MLERTNLSFEFGYQLDKNDINYMNNRYLSVLKGHDFKNSLREFKPKAKIENSMQLKQSGCNGKLITLVCLELLDNSAIPYQNFILFNNFAPADINTAAVTSTTTSLTESQASPAQSLTESHTPFSAFSAMFSVFIFSPASR